MYTSFWISVCFSHFLSFHSGVLIFSKKLDYTPVDLLSYYSGKKILTFTVLLDVAKNDDKFIEFALETLSALRISRTSRIKNLQG